MQNDHKKRVGIVVLNYNGLYDTENCLESIIKINYSNYKLIVVDNASNDGSVEYIGKRYPDVPILKNYSNLGYAGGNNVGIRYALNDNCDFVLLLNNDVIVTKEFLNVLVETSVNHKEIGIVGPMLYFSQDYRINFAGGFINSKTCSCFIRGYDEKDIGLFRETDEVDYISGACMLVKREVFEKIGLLDERYFLLWEETAFCLKAKYNGFGILFVPSAIAYHKESASFKKEKSNKYIYYYTRNKILFAKEQLKYTRIQIASLICSEFINFIRRCKKKTRRREAIINLIAIVNAMQGKYGEGPKII